MGYDALPTTSILRSGDTPLAPINLRRAVMIGNFPPRKCGIATFTRDVFASLVGHTPGCEWSLVVMNDRAGGHAYPHEVTDVIPQHDLAAYVRTADRINASGAEVAFLQHEFGIFGGESGAHVLALLRRLKMPVIVTLHTVLETPSPSQKAVMDEILGIASGVIVMSEMGADIVSRVHGLPSTKLHVIPHGAPDRAFASPEVFKTKLGLAGHNLTGHKVIMTFGLLSPNKGIETIVRGLPDVLAHHSDALYLVVGATHPHLVEREGEAYRQSLIDLAASLGVSDNLRFINRFVDDRELVELLQAADLYVTPYLTEAQITSGTLSYAIALGKPVISTPYWHAREALAGGVGILCGFNDTAAFSREIIGLLSDQVRRETIARRAYRAGEPSRWSRVGAATLGLAMASLSEPVSQDDEAISALAHPKLSTLLSMSDDCGVAQHSSFGVPDRRHGYCSDDNARALSLFARLAAEGDQDILSTPLARSCAAFINHAWNPETGRFRNFMDFDRRWLDDGGSDDCCARCLEALCLVARHADEPGIRDWAADLSRQVSRHAPEWTSLRSHALAIKALITGAGVAIDPDEARRSIRHAADVLARAFDADGRAGHSWFEPVFAYDNARLPEALLLAGSCLDDARMTAMGLAALDTVAQRQTSPAGWFRPVATSSFDVAGAEHAAFDQQPIEALATVDACLAAWRITGDARHADNARAAFEWFGGRNDHGVPLADAESGVCHDGLTCEGVNRNHGAESILSYLLAATEMRGYLRRANALT